MKRRDFLKKLGIVCGVAIAYPGKLLKGKPHPISRPKVATEIKAIQVPWVHYKVRYSYKYPAKPKGGITNTQLEELIKTTLKDLPKTTFIVMDEFATKCDMMYFAYKEQYY